MKWSVKEDLLVCKFYLSNMDCWRDRLCELMLLLKKHGFMDREEGSVKMRIQNFAFVHTGVGLSNVTRQIRGVYHAVTKKITHPDVYNKISTYIAEIYDPTAPLSKGTSYNLGLINPSQLTEYKHNIDFSSSIPMMLQKYMDKKGVKKHKEVYDRIYMKQDTFSSILRGKYSVVKKENILRLCVGLELTIDEAEEFMECAGYIFSRSIMTDVVVKACIINGCYDTFVIDEELDENGAPVLFAL